MRTTITIRDDIYREVKQVAAIHGCSVGSVIEDAISLLLARRSAAPDTSSLHFPELPIFTGGGLMPGVDLDSNASLSELLHEGAVVHALR